MRLFHISLLTVLMCLQVYAQSVPTFNVDAYKTFLSSTQNMSCDQLYAMHPAGLFQSKAQSALSPSYLDSIDSKYSLTNYEKELLAKHGFVVSSRLSRPTFMGALSDIFQKDLPVFISTDAVLHAIHKSYDDILMSVERSRMINWLDSLLANMHNQLPALAARYASEPRMLPMLKDLDVYLTLPRLLLGKSVSPYYSDNGTAISELSGNINALQPQCVKLFSQSERMLDFSQFKVRGHYTQWPELSKYFQAMMWLGRTEIYLIAPKEAGACPAKQTDADIQRQTILALLATEAIESANAKTLLDTLDSAIKFFVGESDNVTLNNIQTLKSASNIYRADALLDTARLRAFKDTLVQQSYAFQRINSQILMSDPTSPDQIKPASAFLLLGQRFVIDSYVTGNVVFDRIVFNGEKIRRMLPSTLDVLFALGNDAAAQLLEPELQKYNYASNLAGLRYLVDSYESDFWSSSLYNGWLQMIRSLNPPKSRQSLPAFMQTAAWWQEKMNTQLGSWAELRHDNLLYAKQSYSGGATCSFPESYVEPFPEFYSNVKRFANIASDYFGRMGETGIQAYFTRMAEIAGILQSIAEKTLAHASLTEEEKIFLKGMLSLGGGGCAGPPYTGWYTELYYSGAIGYDAYDALTADVHTAPTDEFGNFVGWVMHVGTGDVEMAIINTETPDGQPMAYIGPVYKYHELVTTNFQRLSDEEWKELYKQTPPPRPDFVNLYLANKYGESMGEIKSLRTGVNESPIEQKPTTFELSQNFPNPFNPGTTISIIIPPSLAHSVVTVRIYNITGQLVSDLLERELPSGAYAVRWDGTTNESSLAASGVYFYNVSVGKYRKTGKMMLLR